MHGSDGPGARQLLTCQHQHGLLYFEGFVHTNAPKTSISSGCKVRSMDHFVRSLVKTAMAETISRTQAPMPVPGHTPERGASGVDIGENTKEGKGREARLEKREKKIG